MQVEDDGEIEPTFCSPDIGNVARPLTIRGIGGEITIQPVCRDTETMMAVSRNLVPARANWLDPVDVGFAALRVISHPTRRSPTSSPTSFNSIVILGRLPSLRNDPFPTVSN